MSNDEHGTAGEERNEVPLPVVCLTTPLAGQVADLYGYLSDLQLARSFVAELARLADEAEDGSSPPTAATACWHALVVAYRRPFTTGRSFGKGSKRIHVPEDWIDELGGRELHEWLLELANQHVAHQVNRGAHEVRMFVVLSADEPRRILGATQFAVRLITPDRAVDPIGDYLDRLIELLTREIIRGEQLLIDQAHHIGIEKLYAASTIGGEVRPTASD